MIDPEKHKKHEGAPVEIEKKFLVDLETARAMAEQADRQEPIRQGYMVLGADGSEARVRSRTREGRESFTMTVKTKGTEDGLSRGEWETDLTWNQFHSVWPSTQGRRVEKTRYSFDRDGHTLELDIYEGDLEGLATVEVEFPTEAEAGAFEIPEWFGADVTADSAYKNQNLATVGIPE